MGTYGIPHLKWLIIVDRIVFFCVRYIFVWMLASKLAYTFKDCVVLYHGMRMGINILTIVFTHWRRNSWLPFFTACISLAYILGFSLMTLLLRIITLKRYLFPLSYIFMMIGFAGTKCILTDFLRSQITPLEYDKFCSKSAYWLMFSYLGIGLVWPYVLDLIPVFYLPDSYYISFAIFTLVMSIFLSTFYMNLTGNGFRINNRMRREQNFKYMLLVLIVPLYQLPKWGLLQCLGIPPRVKRHKTTLEVGIWFKYALYVYSSSVVAKMVRIWRIVFLMAPMAVYWALVEQQHARWVFTVYQTDRRIELMDWKFYIHPTHFQLFNPLMHLILVPVLCYLVYPFASSVKKKDRIYKVGIVISLAIFFSGTIAYRQTTGVFAPLRPKPRTIVTNIVSGLNMRTFMFAKYDYTHGIETTLIEPLGGAAINAPELNYLVDVNFTMAEQSVIEDFSIRTENMYRAKVQTIFFRRKSQWGEDSLEVFTFWHRYVRPYNFNPTFRVYFANITPVHEVSLMTPFGMRWMSIPTDSSPNVEFQVEPGLYRYAVNEKVSSQPTIVAEFGCYYDAVVYNDKEYFGLEFTMKMPRIEMSYTAMLLPYVLLIVGEIVFWIQGLRLFLYQSTEPEIQQTVIMWWYFTIAVGNFIVLWINEMGIEFYQFDDYQFLCGLLLTMTRNIYFYLSMMFKPLPGTD